jgi:hypothetical protein
VVSGLMSDSLFSPIVTHKECRDCGALKPLSEFSPAPRGVGGRTSYCKPCMNIRSKASRYKQRAAVGRPVTPRRVVAEGTRWCPDCRTIKPLADFPTNRSGRGGFGRYCKPCHNVRGRENVIKNHGSTRDYHLKRRYGITSADFDQILAAQGGVCAVCRTAKAEHVDHDHATGQVRGLLCFNCNQALGNARDDIRVLRLLVDYLHSSRGVRHRVTVESYEPVAMRLEYQSALHARA